MLTAVCQFPNILKSEILKILNDPRLALALPDDGESAAERIAGYLAVWEKWNAKIGLTAEKDAIEVLRRHVFDSLQYARAVLPDGKILDIGSGAGFPGLPLKFVLPQIDLTLVESRRKRCSFLEAVVGALDSPKTEVFNSRVEDLVDDEEFRGRFDQVVFKAVAPLAQCLQWGAPFLKSGGEIIVKKEPGTETPDLDEDRAAPTLLKWSQDFELQSFYGVESCLMVFKSPGQDCDL